MSIPDLAKWYTRILFNKIEKLCNLFCTDITFWVGVGFSLKARNLQFSPNVVILLQDHSLKYQTISVKFLINNSPTN